MVDMIVNYFLKMAGMLKVEFLMVGSTPLSYRSAIPCNPSRWLTIVNTTFQSCFLFLVAMNKDQTVTMTSAATLTGQLPKQVWV